MWRRLFTIFVLLSFAYLLHCRDAKVKFKKSKYGNASNIWMNCSYELSRRYRFKSLNITKDKQLFYSFDENNRQSPRFLPVAGVESIQMLQTPGSFIVQRINKSSEGDYKCTLYYEKGRHIRRESDDFDLDVDSLDFEHHESGTRDHMEVHISCIPHLKPSQRFNWLEIKKGKKRFYYYDTQMMPKFTPVHGINQIEMKGLGVMMIRDVKRRHIRGKYTCRVRYNDRKHYTEHFKISKSGIANISKKLFLVAMVIMVVRSLAF